MIDTIKLVIDKRSAWVENERQFVADKVNKSAGIATLVINPTKAETRREGYKPRLTITKRFNCTGRYEDTLSIEFSAPKLIYQNNFDELTDADFPSLIDKLGTALSSMRIRIFSNSLERAPVSAIHYSKNFALTDGSMPLSYIHRLSKTSLSPLAEIEQVKYRGGGYSTKFHTNGHELIFYDKLKDMAKAKYSEKRAIEKDYATQLDLFDHVAIPKRFEVLRMEARLNKRPVIKRILSKVGINTDLTLKSLFKSDISQKVLLYYLDRVEAQMPPSLEVDEEMINAVYNFHQLHPKDRLTKILSALEASIMIDRIGVSSFRELIRPFGPNSWYGLQPTIKELRQHYPDKSMATIRKALEDFVPLHLVDFQ